MHGREATAVIKERMQEQRQSCCQAPTYLEQQVILHAAREMNPFLLSSALCSRVPAVGIGLGREKLRKDEAWKLKLTTRTTAFTNTTEI